LQKRRGDDCGGGGKGRRGEEKSRSPALIGGIRFRWEYEMYAESTNPPLTGLIVPVLIGAATEMIGRGIIHLVLVENEKK
jgi:hypothetical protein